MAHQGSTQRRTGHGARAGLLLGLLVTLALPATALDAWSPTGLRATIHTPEDIEEQFLVQEGNRLYLRHPAIGELELATEAPGGRDLVTAEASVVADALATVQGFRSDLHVNVFILPAFPQIVTSSFARQDAIFLAPAFGVQSDDVVSYIVVHELGHVMCWASLDGRPERWDQYLALRGLVPQGDPGSLPHAERNREIVAEDFRALFGGALATASGTIENASLPHPGAVPGLRAFLADGLAGDQVAASNPSSTVYPNPCREQARIELTLSDAANKAVSVAPRLEIYDLRGRLVRRVSGGSVANGRASVIWDGRDEGGRRAPGGLYLYRVASGSDRASGRLLLVDH